MKSFRLKRIYNSFPLFFQQSKRGNKLETPFDAQTTESESHLATNPVPDRDDEGNPVTPGPTSAGINLESATKDSAPQGILSTDGAISRLRGTEQTALSEQQQQQQQQPRVQFTPANNYYKNVSDNKDIAKLVSLLVTCINATKKVYLYLILLI